MSTCADSGALSVARTPRLFTVAGGAHAASHRAHAAITIFRIGSLPPHATGGRRSVAGPTTALKPCSVGPGPSRPSTVAFRRAAVPLAPCSGAPRSCGATTCEIGGSQSVECSGRPRRGRDRRGPRHRPLGIAILMAQHGAVVVRLRRLGRRTRSGRARQRGGREIVKGRRRGDRRRRHGLRDHGGGARIVNSASRSGQLDIVVTCAGILRDRMIFAWPPRTIRRRSSRRTKPRSRSCRWSATCASALRPHHHLHFGCGTLHSPVSPTTARRRAASRASPKVVSRDLGEVRHHVQLDLAGRGANDAHRRVLQGARGPEGRGIVREDAASRRSEPRSGRRGADGGLPRERAYPERQRPDLPLRRSVVRARVVPASGGVDLQESRWTVDELSRRFPTR